MNDRPGNRTTSRVWSRHAQVVQGTPSGSSGPAAPEIWFKCSTHWIPKTRTRAALCHVSIYALAVNLYHGSWIIYSTYIQWIIFVLHLTISRKLKHRVILLDPYIVSLWSFVYFPCFQQNTRLVGEISGHLRSQKSIAWTQSFRLQEYWLFTYLSPEIMATVLHYPQHSTPNCIQIVDCHDDLHLWRSGNGFRWFIKLVYSMF